MDLEEITIIEAEIQLLLRVKIVNGNKTLMWFNRYLEKGLLCHNTDSRLVHESISYS